MEHYVTAKLFMNGNSQAVRLPKSFRFDAKEVLVRHARGGIFLKAKPQVKKRKSAKQSKKEWIRGWEEFFARPVLVDDGYMDDVVDLPPQERDFF